LCTYVAPAPPPPTPRPTPSKGGKSKGKGKGSKGKGGKSKGGKSKGSKGSKGSKSSKSSKSRDSKSVKGTFNTNRGGKKGEKGGNGGKRNKTARFGKKKNGELDQTKDNEEKRLDGNDRARKGRVLQSTLPPKPPIPSVLVPLPEGFVPVLGCDSNNVGCILDFYNPDVARAFAEVRKYVMV